MIVQSPSLVVYMDLPPIEGFPIVGHPHGRHPRGAEGQENLRKSVAKLPSPPCSSYRSLLQLHHKRTPPHHEAVVLTADSRPNPARL